MRRARKSEIIRRTTEYVASLVAALPEADNGLWDVVEDAKEVELVVATVQKIADAIHTRAERR